MLYNNKKHSKYLLISLSELIEENLDIFYVS